MTTAIFIYMKTYEIQLKDLKTTYQVLNMLADCDDVKDHNSFVVIKNIVANAITQKVIKDELGTD